MTISHNESPAFFSNMSMPSFQEKKDGIIIYINDIHIDAMIIEELLDKLETIISVFEKNNISINIVIL